MKKSGKEQTNERKANGRNKTIGRVNRTNKITSKRQVNTSKQNKYNETMTEPKVRHYKRERTSERRKDRKISR